MNLLLAQAIAETPDDCGCIVCAARRDSRIRLEKAGDNITQREVNDLAKREAAIKALHDALPKCSFTQEAYDLFNQFADEQGYPVMKEFITKFKELTEFITERSEEYNQEQNRHVAQWAEEARAAKKGESSPAAQN